MNLRKPCVSCLIFIAIILSFSFPSFAALTDGLVGYWSFNNCDANDDSGNGHIGAPYGSPTPQCVDGIKGKAFNFNGQNYKAGSSVAGDLHLYHQGTKENGQGLNWGLALSNLGSKMSYSKSRQLLLPIWFIK